jgi:hypothetical protein
MVTELDADLCLAEGELMACLRRTRTLQAIASAYFVDPVGEYQTPSQEMWMTATSLMTEVT